MSAITCDFTQKDFEVTSLCSVAPKSAEAEQVIEPEGGKYTSPLATLYKGHKFFVTDEDRVLLDCTLGADGGCVGASPLPHDDKASTLSLLRAGPRTQLHFDAKEVRAAIVTCGGLCPGLNNVIRSVTRELLLNYGAKQVLGMRFGYQGLNPSVGLEPIDLTRETVENINEFGGTMLGSSRGPQDVKVMLDFLVSLNVNVLICVGGDGTLRGAHSIAEEAIKRGLDFSVVGIPKTIDNDINFVHRSFGYETALEQSLLAINAAHSEARSARYGIGLVKLMGRYAGFIAAGASAVSQKANFCLVPEVDFPLEGKDGLLEALEQRLLTRNHAVIVVAEGTGQHLFKSDEKRDRKDASGNVKAEEIGLYLRDKIFAYFKTKGLDITLKYIDPSYMIRSCVANTHDRELTDLMARHAVHAAMAGKTDVLVGHVNNEFVLVPIGTSVATLKRMDTNSSLWTQVLLSTGQPNW